MKNYRVTIELNAFETRVFANNKTEARKKALVKLSKKNILTLISKVHGENKKDISIDEEW